MTSARGVLVHEWIAQAGGSENVLQTMAEIYPEADVVCLWNDSTGRFDDSRLMQTWLARTPLRRSKAASLPFMPLAWRGLPNRGYSWALISSHLFAHHARFADQPADFSRFVYVHTPARYIWNPELDARGNNVMVKAVAAAFKPLDRRRAQDGASFAANSAFVQDRMRVAWGVDSRVIYPPVEVEAIQEVHDWSSQLEPGEADLLAQLPDGFVLGASRFIPYKRLDLVVATAEALGRPVVLAGRGPGLDDLRQVAAKATVPVHLVVSPSTSLLRALYQRTSLFVFPAVEDFGIMPVEAMAAGAPVLAQAVGGTAESTDPGVTGALIRFENAAEMVEGAEIALATSREDRLLAAKKFSRQTFADEVTRWVGAT